MSDTKIIVISLYKIIIIFLVINYNPKLLFFTVFNLMILTNNYSPISELRSKTVQLVNQVEKNESLGNRDIEDQDCITRQEGTFRWSNCISKHQWLIQSRMWKLICEA